MKMALCSPNPYNLTITLSINELNTKTELFYINKSNGFMSGTLGRFSLETIPNGLSKLIDESSKRAIWRLFFKRFFPG